MEILYYLRYGDNSGELVFKRVMDAARRGVRVRLITDDVLLASEDETIAVIDAHPNVEVRLFNPWRQYSSRRKVKAAQTSERFNSGVSGRARGDRRKSLQYLCTAVVFRRTLPPAHAYPHAAK